MTDISDISIFIVFFLSFYSKVQNIMGFGVEISSYRIVSFQLSKLFAYLVLILELLIILCYWAELFPFTRNLVVAGLLLVFSLLTLYKRRKLKITSCNCFGEIEFLNKFPISRNLILVSIIILGYTINHHWVEVHEVKNIIMIFLVNVIIAIDVFLNRVGNIRSEVMSER